MKIPPSPHSPPTRGHTFRKNDDHILFHKLEENEMSIPDSELHV